ncbi:MAG: sulfotransferase [Gammaproteobacteria bacterium]|nr:sulfotransferase [Gammaproteobacteria bacterium]
MFDALARLPRELAERLARARLHAGGDAVDLQPDKLIAAALARAGSRDFGDFDPRPGLEALLDSLQREARLSPVGHLLTRWDLLRLLGNLASMARLLRQRPQIRAGSLPAPWIITGMPRSGSTFLHRLLAQEPNHRVARHFETIHPPLGAPRVWRRARVRLELAGLHLLRPHFNDAHPLGIDTPQECTELTSPAIASLRFDTTYTAIAYRQWFDANGAAQAYRFHRSALQLLQYGEAPRRWVLKSPDHVFALPALLTEYPDARLIFTHRDALEVLPSVINLTILLRSIFSSEIDARAVAVEVAARWAQGAEHLLAADRLIPPERRIHVHYRDIARQPLQTVERIYHRFGLTLSAPARARMQAFVSRHPDGDYRTPRLRVEDFQLNSGGEQRRFAAYRAWIEAPYPER